MKIFSTQTLLIVLLFLFIFLGNAQIVPFGNGSYTTQLPSGEAGPVVFQSYFKPGKSILPTNDWWSSLGFRFLQHNTYSEPMFPQPLIVKAEAIGLGVGDGSKPNIVNNNQFQATYSPDLFIKLEGLNTNETRVEDYTDWMVKAHWKNGNQELWANFGHGSPYIYCETSNNQTARLSFTNTNITIEHNQGNALCIGINGKYYGIFAPSGVNWVQYANDFAATLGSKNYFSVALLPNNNINTFNTFKNHAFVYITNSVFTWDYNEQNANTSGTFTFTTAVKEGNENRVLTSLFPHQWKHTSATLQNFEYATVRGKMKGFVGNNFTVNYTAMPMLPYILEQNLDNPNRTYTLVDREYQTLINQNGFNRTDTYWHGKELNRYAQLLPLAQQCGHTVAFNYILNLLKSDLQNWFTASPGEKAKLFYYDPMGVLIGYPASFNTNTELNDMHFHYSYFVMAAATIARYDKNWANQWKDMVELLIRNCNSWMRNDDKFPFLRYFDPYQGHNWANGWALFGDGNNMESSSESIFFSAAMIQWGKEMCNNDILSLGMIMYHSEVIAAEQYWFNVDKDNFPAGYPKDYAAINWGSGGVFGTFWTANEEEVRGINILPVTGYSLYLGRKPDYVQSFYNNLINEGGLDFWRYVHWSYLSLGNSAQALNEYNAFAPAVDVTEFGSTEAFTNHWLNTHHNLGKVQHQITANNSLYSAFKNNDEFTYIAYNPGCNAAKTVNFSNGYNMQINPGEYKIVSTNTVTNTSKLNASEVKIYPNPTSDFVQIEITEPNFSVEITDINGKILALQYNQKQISLAPFIAGTYNLKIKTNQNTTHHKIIKQ